MSKRDKLKPFGKAVVRLPVFPFEYLEKYGTALENDIMQEALLLSSPDLVDALNVEWGEKKDAGKQRALIKYWSRACYRCTPFGLFSGCSFVATGEETRIVPAPTSEYKLKLRLDSEYICKIIDHLERDGDLRRQLKYYPNETLYEIGGTLRYIEYKTHKDKRKHEVSLVDNDEYLAAVLSRAKAGMTLQELAEGLVDDDITFEEAQAYIDELVDSQLLKSELYPSVVGDDIMDTLLGSLERSGWKNKEILDPLTDIACYLRKISDSEIGKSRRLYQDLENTIKKTGIDYNRKHLYQADLYIPFEKNSVSSSVISDIGDCLSFLNNFASPYRIDILEKFKEEFIKRYEEEPQPLLAVLDKELGIGYPPVHADQGVNPLIDDIVLPGLNGGSNSTVYTVTNLEHVILSKYIDGCEKYVEEIVFSDKDFDLKNKSPVTVDTVAVMCSVLKDDQEGRSVYLKSAGGSTATGLLGRFCHIDESINQIVKEIAEVEAELNPDKVIAEISHLPDSRLANIASRPSFRDFEIHYMSNGWDKGEKALPPDDLYVSVQNNRIVLKSQTLGKEIIPKLSCAHNYSMSNVPFYRFLCDIQTQGVPRSLLPASGSLLSSWNYRPRICFNNIVLWRRRWRLKTEDIAKLNSADSKDFAEQVVDYMSRNRLPRYVVYAQGDNELLIDMTNRDFLAILHEEIPGKMKEFYVEESLYNPEESVIARDGQHFTNEFIFLFHR